MEFIDFNNGHSNILNCSKKTQLFKKKDIIYTEKQDIKSIFVVLDGIVESFSSNKSMKNKLDLGKGSSLGLIDTILGRPYSRNMLAKTTVSLALIDKTNLHDILNNNNLSGIFLKSLAIDIDNKYPYLWS